MKVLIYNLLAIIAFAFLLVFCYSQLGYKHTFNLLRCDYVTAFQTRDMSKEERNVVKLGMGYELFKYVRENTPDTAVIYLPDPRAFLLDGYGDKFSSPHFSHKLWAVRFLYPRKIVTNSEYSFQGAIPPLTHVLLINGKGKELLG